MFGPLGAPEILFILLLALLIFGPRRLPEMGRTVGKALGEFRRATTDLKRSINTEIALEEADERPKVTRGPDRKPRETPAGGVDEEGLLAPAPEPVAAEGTEPRRAPGEGGGTAETAEAAGDGAGTPAGEDGSAGVEAAAGEPAPADAAEGADDGLGDGADDGADDGAGDGEGEVAARG